MKTTAKELINPKDNKKTRSKNLKNQKNEAIDKAKPSNSLIELESFQKYLNKPPDQDKIKIINL